MGIFNDNIIKENFYDKDSRTGEYKGLLSIDQIAKSVTRLHPETYAFKKKVDNIDTQLEPEEKSLKLSYVNAKSENKKLENE